MHRVSIIICHLEDILGHSNNSIIKYVETFTMYIFTDPTQFEERNVCF